MNDIPALYLASLLSGCESEQEFFGPEDPYDGGPHGGNLSNARATDTFIQKESREVDVLFVIDNSCSMDNEQENLANNFPKYLDAFRETDISYRMGVTTTDMYDPNHQGRLQPANDGLTFWVAPDTPMIESKFAQMVSLGTAGYGVEKGLDAAYYGAIEYAELDYLRNQEFFRPSARLSLVFVSDEPDQSDITPSDFVNFFDNLEEQKELAYQYPKEFPFLPTEQEVEDHLATLTESEKDSFLSSAKDNVEANSIVSYTYSDDYLGVTEWLGGISWSIGKPDWGDKLKELGLATADLNREFYLSSRPLIDEGLPLYESFDVYIRYQNEDENQITWTNSILADKYSYDSIRNSITFEDPVFFPPEHAEVEISYDKAGSAQ